MAPPSLPRPLPRPPEDRRPDRPPPEHGGVRLPAVARPHRVPDEGEPSRRAAQDSRFERPAADGGGRTSTAATGTDRPRPAPHPVPQLAPRAVPDAVAQAGQPHRPADRAGAFGPPSGERLGRLPGPGGADRIASGVPLPGSAAAFDLPALPAAVGTARRIVADLLTAWGVPEYCRDDVVLVASELVTNALVHAAGERVVCRLHDLTDRIRIEVEDQDGGRGLPAVRRPGPEDPHGRGLFLVDALSLDWGVTPVPGRPAHVVRAELPSGRP
ncbi:ATP-binding protein [Streptomyces sp. NPDC051133]|uniref:ATP-binding protein n=1 Tax=Streptomyces sp. NPDC051133 TaxID=3155521 RepID=UPI0034403EC3